MECAGVELYDATFFERSFAPRITETIDRILREATTYEGFVVPYCDDLLPFTTLSCEEPSALRARGWLPGIVRGRRMRVDIGALSDRKLNDLMGFWWTQITERSLSETVPREIQQILDRTPANENPFIPYREELSFWLMQFIPVDDADARKRGWVPAVIRGRRVRAEIAPLFAKPS